MTAHPGENFQNKSKPAPAFTAQEAAWFKPSAEEVAAASKKREEETARHDAARAAEEAQQERALRVAIGEIKGEDEDIIPRPVHGENGDQPGA